ncbi:hypothetical protein Tco_1089763 [Tanacetum coccineum]
MENIANHCDHPLSALTGLEPDTLARLAPILTHSIVVAVFPPSPKESTVTPASPPKELVSKDISSSSKASMNKQPSKDQTEEWVDEMINGPDEEMAEAEANKTVDVIVQVVILQVYKDASNAGADVALVQDTEPAPSTVPNDVVVALAVAKEGEGAPGVSQDVPAANEVAFAPPKA